MEKKNYKAIVEAILFTMGESVELTKIANTIELDAKETKKILEDLQKELDLKKYNDSLLNNKDMCGEYDYCKYCNKNNSYPCAKSFNKFKRKN